jgi:proline iminopeptidase
LQLAFSGSLRKLSCSHPAGRAWQSDSGLPQAQLEAACAWSVWEGTTLSLFHDPERIQKFGNDTYALAFARIECHYFINKGFFRCDNQLIEDCGRIAHIPGTIVHGRYDVVTPVKNAWDLAKAWPKAELRIVSDAGHAMTEPGNIHEIVSATDKYAGAA